MTPDYCPLTPGLRLEYAVRRAQETRTLVVEHLAAEGGVSLRRTWTGADGRAQTRTTRAERRADGVYEDGEKVLPLPPAVGAAWDSPPNRLEIAALGEDVTTPAGRLRGCLRVDYLIAAGDAGSGRRWYAPGLGLAREECADEADPFDVTLTAVTRP